MTSMLPPVIALICWSLIVLAWLYATRIPAIGRAGIDPATAQEPNALDALPLAVRQVGYNYNHLMEQPTLFYALALSIQLSGGADQANIALAWSYVGLRVIHSLIQGTVNVVTVRFGVFAVSSLVLAAMAVREAAALMVR